MLPTAVGGCGADLRDVAAASGTGRADRRVGVARARTRGSATLALAAVGFALALGEYDVGAYLWIELAFVVATVLLAVAVFSRSARRPLARTVPLLRRLRVERPIRAVYEGVHAVPCTRLLIGVFALTLAIQAVRVLAIWCTAEAVGIGLSPRVYYVMGPLLFLVMLVPFTINGLAVREAFFVSFLGQLGVRRRRLRRRVPVLPRHDRARDSGCAHPRLGEHSPAGQPVRPSWLMSPSWS